jgi:hypothetical protein
MAYSARKTPPKYPRIDEVIKEMGSVAQFCRDSGVYIMTYYAMQAGRTTPTLGLIYKVLDYTGMTFEEAFGQ